MFEDWSLHSRWNRFGRNRNRDDKREKEISWRRWIRFDNGWRWLYTWWWMDSEWCIFWRKGIIGVRWLGYLEPLKTNEHGFDLYYKLCDIKLV